MPTSDNPDETPWQPHTLRERVYFALIRFLTWVFRVDFFDVYRRQEVTYDERDEIYRMQMRWTEQLRDEWLHTYKRQCEFYDDNEEDDWVPYAMWLVMRADDTINPSVVLHGEKQDDGTWEHAVDDGPEEPVKVARKRELLRAVDERGFIDPVLSESDDHP